MSRKRPPVMRFLLDEGVPVSVGKTLRDAGHKVILFNDSGLAKGSSDPVVCTAAEMNDAILVAADGDMKRLARDRGVKPARFKKLGLLKFNCRKPDASRRTSIALSLLEHEWQLVLTDNMSRFFVVIGKAMIRTHR